MSRMCLEPIRFTTWTWTLGFLIVLLALAVCAFAEDADQQAGTDALLVQIEKLAEIEEEISPEAGVQVYKDIIRQIEAHPVILARRLIEEIENPDISEEKMTAFIWAVGFTRDPNAVNTLINISKTSNNDAIRFNAMRSLAKIGTDEAGEFLLSQVSDAASSADANVPYGVSRKYELLDLLGEMQYAPAIPVMGDLLKMDYRRYFWQPMFCFGKMGDKSIPYLLDKLESTEKDVRFHSLNVLARILLAREAAKPLQERYWVEKDKDVKGYILPTLERLIYVWGEMESFFAKVVEKEEDTELRTFAKETLETLDDYKKTVADFESGQEDNREAFEKEYTWLYDSFGKEGDFDKLGRYSRHEDEEQLKELRARILQRGSDECFYDCDKLNRIIMMNRFIAAN